MVKGFTVREILEILEDNPKVTKEGLFDDLYNVIYTEKEITLDTIVPEAICKNLGRKYGQEIKKTKKPKKETPKEEPKPEPKAEPKPVVEDKKEKVEEKPKVEAKSEPKKEEPKQKVEVPKSKPEPKKETSKEEPQEEFEDEDEVELSKVYDGKYDEYEVEAKTYTRLKNVKKKRKVTQRQSNVSGSKKADENVLIYTPGMTVAQIADGLTVSVGEIVKKLVMLGYMYNATAALDKDLAELLAEDAGFILKEKILEDITKFEEMKIEDNPEDLVARSPIITIMGHVDHGKTTLLDTIRNTRVTASEAGGITQHIGAYQVEKSGRKITFIDTPGHAAFTEMRARGAQVTDIVVLVVAADDGIMPQTVEAIDHAKAAKVPIIVAINKMDKPQAHPDQVLQELTKYGLVPEVWGGDTICVPISALKAQGIEELLEMILLTADMLELKANPNRLGIGTVVEAKLDRGRGPVATLLVSNGTIKIGDPIVVGTTYGRIRSMTDEKSKLLTSAGPAKAVEITGLSDVPEAGDHFMVFDDEKTARLVAEERNIRKTDAELNAGAVSLVSALSDDKELNLIIKGDVQGSIEALKSSLQKINIDGVKINIIRTGVGSVTETDIALASTSGSIIIGFNIRPRANILDYAKEKNIEVRLYSVIYKLLEDIEEAMTGMLDPEYEEKVIGEAEVRNTFKASKIGTIAGLYVTNGVIHNGDSIRLIRDSIVIYNGKIGSLRRFDDDVKEVREGFECGLTIKNFNDIKEGDLVETYRMVEVKRNVL
ncbi:MAG TPA: translation initiation factor IF-2 [Bacilli bacterium]|jgi:translation initiation factor IF-2|nr:translation initiation factor IF-2 [Bacilli bacterium]HOH58397.1 translation initiation factor IF-2 [Bacilli bacterium]